MTKPHNGDRQKLQIKAMITLTATLTQYFYYIIVLDFNVHKLAEFAPSDFNRQVKLLNWPDYGFQSRFTQGATEAKSAA